MPQGWIPSLRADLPRVVEGDRHRDRGQGHEGDYKKKVHEFNAYILFLPKGSNSCEGDPGVSRGAQAGGSG
jgi:hypothetical protein